MKALTAFLKELMFLGFESFGRYYSCYRAFVSDNKDPENLGRIKVTVPEIMGEDEYDYWVFAKNQYSGLGHGMQVIPSVGEMVWVEFEQGMPEKPIWSHGHFGVGDKPKPKQDKDFNDITSYYFATPKGNIVYINDTKNIISVTSSEGDRLEINRRAISLSTDKKISLGKLNKSDEPAVLGKKNEDVLNEIHSLLKDMVIAINADVAASTAANQPFLLRATLNQKAPTWLTKIASIKALIKKTKSTKVTLD